MKTVSVCVALFAALSVSLCAAERLVVHEWGTFTSFQDEAGRSIAGINADDEPVPDFVHRYPRNLLYDTMTGMRPSMSNIAMFGKGLPMSHPDVRMRMETPVIYFYPPEGQPQMMVDVEVQFKGGWLTEFYPMAEAESPGIVTVDRPLTNGGPYQVIGHINPLENGILRWKGVTIGKDGTLPETDEAVWLAPRKVDAATVTLPNGEAEKYLFYRGVGNLVSPLTVYTTYDGLSFEWQEGLSTPALWLVDVREDGAVAFRKLKPDVEQVSPIFTPGSYTKDNLAELQASMHTELVKDGLYEKEAAAMLETWKAAYFKAPGTRVFYLLPKTWTDETLPLSITNDSAVDMDVVRTMVGRVELVTPRQQQLLAKMKTLPYDFNWRQSQLVKQYPDAAKRNEVISKLYSGKISSDEAGLETPEIVKAFTELGRFRVPLLIHYGYRYQSKSLYMFKTMKGIRFNTPVTAEGLAQYEKKTASVSRRSE